MLGKTYGTISQAVFVLLGAVGVPVFSGFKGGLGTILGPTGGFIVGYILSAFITGLIIERFGVSWAVLITAMYAGWVVTYASGTVWYITVTGTRDIAAVLSVCVFPFLFGDVLKNIISAVAIRKLKPVFQVMAKER